MRFPGAWIALAALAGCDTGPDGTLCGNSAGCGNPTKLAELQVSQAGCPGCSGGAAPGIPFTVEIGDSLVIRMDTSGLAMPDSIRWNIVLYQGFQVPALSPAPLDTLSYRAGAVVLHPGDLRHARLAAPGYDTGTFAFSIHVSARIYKLGLEFDDAALLAGLGLDTTVDTFVVSRDNPLGERGRIHHLKAPISSFRGRIADWQDKAAGAGAAYAYIPGSPYSGVISMTDGRFGIDSLPYGEAFEVRMLVLPADGTGGRTAPAYVLESEPSDDADRLFRMKGAPDSVPLP